MDEAPFWIAVNGTRRVVLSCGPGDSRGLAIGHLIGEGWITGVGDVIEHAVRTGPGGSSGVSVVIAEDLEQRAESLRGHQLLHGCGLRHHLDCGDPAPRVATAPAAADLPAALRELFAGADAASPQGGVHAAALCSGPATICVCVDVARHCAVDRVIGAAALRGIALPRHGLVLTSRVSAAMVLKAARAGIPWIASRSVGTPLAHELAAATGITIVEKAARAHGRDLRIGTDAPDRAGAS